MTFCDYCGAANPDMKRCGECLSVRYCNETCQRAHWSDHQITCTPITESTFDVTDPSSEATDPSSEATDPSSEATDPSSDVTGVTDPSYNNGSFDTDNVVSVCPVVDDPDNSGFGVLSSPSSTGKLVNYQTGRTYLFDRQEVIRRYKGVEQEMIVKIQVPWTEEGHPEVNRELWVYDKTRNFTVCILPRDPNCGVIRNKILSEGLPCIRPGRKLYFKARLSREFLLKIELDKTVLANW